MLTPTSSVIALANMNGFVLYNIIPVAFQGFRSFHTIATIAKQQL
jgi:hypothetical protein